MSEATLAPEASTKHVGRRVTGLTNAQLAAGRGTYVSDVSLPGMTWMAFLRSPYAHARIRSIDASAARARPGVVLVLTGEDAQRDMNPIPEGWNTREIGAKGVEWYPIVSDRVRYVGEIVAAVVAEDRWTASAALDDIVVDYEELRAIIDPIAAMQPGADLVEPAWGDNLLITRDWRAGDVDAAFADATHVFSGSVRSNRITGVSIEGRGCVASWDPYLERLTFWESTQNPHPLRSFLAETLELAEGSIHVIQPHVGGAFGLKQPPFQEEPAVAYASRRLGRPVKWIEERWENFQATGHSRDTRFEYEVACDAAGRVSGLRVRTIADVGAPTALLGWGQSFVTAYSLPGVYDIPNIRVELFVVVTNKCPWNSYRGFGKDAQSFVMDRIMDHIASETGVDRAEVRMRNFIPPDDFPHSQPSGAMLDSGDYPGAMSKLLKRVDVPAFRVRQAEALAQGRRLGLGVGQELTPEGCAMPGALMISAYDGATVRIAPSGDVTILTGITSPGCGNETALAQIAADVLGCRFETIRVIMGDTELCPYGLGNYSSRGTMYGGSATQLAANQLREKLHAVAGSMLEAAPSDLDAADGRIFVKGSPERGVEFTSVVNEIYRHTFGQHAENVEPGLEATRYFRMGNIYHQPEKQGRFSNYPAWPFGSSAAVVDVDEETGVVRILDYTLVEDAGTLINPLLVDANLQGAITQGIGSAMYESIEYDENGQLQTATLMDYTIPTAIEVPNFTIEHQETKSPFTPLGQKGAGESGVGSALGAVISGIEDAFPELDLRITQLPLTPHRVWSAIRDARRAAEATAGAVEAAVSITQEIEFFAPPTLEEAVRLLAEHGDEAKLMGGGMSLMPTMNLGLARPSVVISLNHVHGLDAIELDGGQLRIGGLVRHFRIASDGLVERHVPLLSEAAKVIGDPQVRNRGTLGGSIAHADPAADYLPVMIVTGSTVVVSSVRGAREIPAREFFVDVLTSAVEPDEVVTEVRIPVIDERDGSAYRRLARLEGSFPIVNAAAIVRRGSRAAHVAIGGVAGRPVLVDVSASVDAAGQVASEAVAEAASAACVDAFADLSGDSEYRQAMAGVYARRAVDAAAAASAG